MKINAFLFFAIVAIQVCNAQLTTESVKGLHSGYHSWDKSLLTIELKENQVYEIKSYNRELAEEKTIKGRWRIEGDHVVLTDLLGGETILMKHVDECFLMSPNGISCMARFSMNKKLEDYWTDQKRNGC